MLTSDTTLLRVPELLMKSLIDADLILTIVLMSYVNFDNMPRSCSGPLFEKPHKLSSTIPKKIPISSTIF